MWGRALFHVGTGLMWGRALLPVHRAQLDGFFATHRKLAYHRNSHSQMYPAPPSRTLFLGFL
jgi:hypothetical protein